jgi:hypothetical protein
MVATKIRLLDEAKPEAAEAAAIEAELAAKGCLRAIPPLLIASPPRATSI